MRLFLNVVFAAAACVQCAVVSAQVPSQRIILRLGMTGAEVRKAFGTPQIYRQSKPARDFPSSAAGVMPPSHDYHDVYEIKTSLNAYEDRKSVAQAVTGVQTCALPIYLSSVETGTRLPKQCGRCDATIARLSRCLRNQDVSERLRPGGSVRNG